MTINDLAKELATDEGGLSQAKFGDIKQLLAILSDKMYADSTIAALFIQNGFKRARAGKSTTVKSKKK